MFCGAIPRARAQRRVPRVRLTSPRGARRARSRFRRRPGTLPDRHSTAANSRKFSSTVARRRASTPTCRRAGRCARQHQSLLCANGLAAAALRRLTADAALRAASRRVAGREAPRARRARDDGGLSVLGHRAPQIARRRCGWRRRRRHASVPAVYGAFAERVVGPSADAAPGLTEAPSLRPPHTSTSALAGKPTPPFQSPVGGTADTCAKSRMRCCLPGDHQPMDHRAGCCRSAAGTEVETMATHAPARARTTASASSLPNGTPARERRGGDPQQRPVISSPLTPHLESICARTLTDIAHPPTTRRNAFSFFAMLAAPKSSRAEELSDLLLSCHSHDSA